MAVDTGGPTYALGSVNVDSLKEILKGLAAAYPFLDETTKKSFESQIENLHTDADPHATPEEVAAAESSDKDAEIAKLRDELAKLQGGGSGN